MELDDIKFRGKRLINGEWVYGHYMTYDGRPAIQYADAEGYNCYDHVIPKTVGQYTGLTDKNEREVYGQDIWSYDGHNYLVRWLRHSAGFHLTCVDADGPATGLSISAHLIKCGEVIGNAFDNRDLIDPEFKEINDEPESQT